MNIQVELTNKCNLSCIECPNRYMTRGRSVMESSLFNDYVLDYIRSLDGEHPTVILHKDGEPFLNRNLKYYMRRISDARPDIKMDIYTNGFLLNIDFMYFLETIVNPVWLLVSFHFVDKDCRLVDYGKVNERLEECIAMKLPNVEFVLVTHQHDYVSSSLLADWKEDWTRRLANIKGHHVREVAINHSINPWTQLIKDSHNSHFDSCPYLDGNHMFVGVTGNVLPCCMDLNEELILANVCKNTQEEVLQAMAEFYVNLRDKKEVKPLCQLCLGLTERVK